jgi:hypothetical protein
MGDLEVAMRTQAPRSPMQARMHADARKSAAFSTWRTHQATWRTHQAT